MNNLIKKFIITMALFFTFQASAGFEDPRPNPPGGGGIDFCRIACFGGCPPTSPSCSLQRPGVEDLFIKAQKGIIIEDGYLSYIESSPKRTSVLRFDMYTGQGTISTALDGQGTTIEFKQIELSPNFVDLTLNLSQNVFTNSGSYNAVGGCGSAGAALISAVGAYMAARATGDSGLIGDAWATVETAMTYMVNQCHQL